MNNKELSIVKTAEAFNNHFLNPADDLQIQIDNETSPISLLKNTYQKIFQMNIIPVTEGETQSLMCSLKVKGSSGYDGISTMTLKMCNSLISKPLSYICNKSSQTGVFPDHLKYAVVQPLHTIRDRSSMSNDLFIVFTSLVNWLS
jgi:hypothetical protein